VAGVAKASGFFGSVVVARSGLRCGALNAAEEAWYAVFPHAGSLYVALQTPHRYLSQSIEADLVHTGDKLEDLLLEELVERSYTGPAMKVEHFRDEAKLYTFRSRVPLESIQPQDHARVISQCLLAYEAMFRPLGDMDADDDE
jgi:hypothetical protein